MARHRRFYPDSARQAFYRQMRQWRSGRIDVQRAAPIGGDDFLASEAIKDGIDIAGGILTGERVPADQAPRT